MKGFVVIGRHVAIPLLSFTVAFDFLVFVCAISFGVGSNLLTSDRMGDGRKIETTVFQKKLTFNRRLITVPDEIRL